MPEVVRDKSGVAPALVGGAIPEVPIRRGPRARSVAASARPNENGAVAGTASKALRTFVGQLYICPFYIC